MPKNKQKPAEDEELELDDEDADDEVDEDADDDVEDADEEASENGASKKGKGKGKGGHLVPREPVAVSKAVFKAQKPEVQKLLKQREKAQAEGNKKELRKIRMALRKAGFKLSKVGAASED